MQKLKSIFTLHTSLVEVNTFLIKGQNKCCSDVLFKLYLQLQTMKKINEYWTR